MNQDESIIARMAAAAQAALNASISKAQQSITSLGSRISSSLSGVGKANDGSLGYRPKQEQPRVSQADSINSLTGKIADAEAKAESMFIALAKDIADIKSKLDKPVKSGAVSATGFSFGPRGVSNQSQSSDSSSSSASRVAIEVYHPVNGDDDLPWVEDTPFDLYQFRYNDVSAPYAFQYRSRQVNVRDTDNASPLIDFYDYGSWTTIFTTIADVD